MTSRGALLLLSSTLWFAVGCGIQVEGSLDLDSLGEGGQNAGGGGSGGAAGTLNLSGKGGSGQGGGGGKGGSAGSVSGSSGTSGSSGKGGSDTCTSPAECGDDNPCTVDACENNKCKHTPLAQGTSCSDGDKCNGDEICSAEGACVATNVPVIDDGLACTTDLCDPATGTVNHKGKPDCNCESDADCNDNNVCTIDLCVNNKCSYTEEVAGKDCDDGNLCTESDKCDTGGKCQGSLINVDDANPCTTDTCDSATGNPVHQGNLGQVCSDGNKCTIDDQCDGNGSCVGFEIPTDDSNPCTTDFCDPATGSIDHKGQSGCAPCTKDADCDDGNSCTVDVCLGDVCSYTDVPVGGSCDDNNKCTTGETCDNSGKCTGTPVTDDDGNPCTKDECDPDTGTVPHLPAPGQPCNDGNACILGDICDETGKCVGVQKSVDDGNECTDDACNPATGDLTHIAIDGCKPCASDADCNDGKTCTNETCDGGKCKYTNSGSGTSCDDGNNCTISDECDGNGSCAGTAKNVDDNDPCTADSCDPATGNPKNTPTSGPTCDDGNGCTVGDQCNAGLCVGIAKIIDDGNACTNDACDQATGTVSHSTVNGCKSCTTNTDCNDNNTCTDETCDAGKCKYTNKPNTTSCDDNNKCTTGDKCDGSGACKSGALTACTTPPGDCYDVGSCNPGDGQCVYPLKSNGSTCNDSNACTNNDKCTTGTCAGTLVNGCKTCTVATQATDCVDNNPCTDNICSGGKCTNPNNTATCDDNNACTTNDKCSGGVCGGTTVGGCKSCSVASDCGDGNLCTDDTCVSGKCSNPNNTATCNDNNACTNNDICGGGSCAGTVVNGCKTCTVATQAADCNDGNLCTDDLCSGGKCTNPNNTVACDDNNACTVGDKCSAGSCTSGTVTPPTCKPCTVATQATDCNDNNPCTDELCVSGKCTNPNNTVACDDNNACTVGDKCSAGFCTPGTVTPPTCKPCTPATQATDCNDNNPCTDELCVSGKCTNPNNTVACDDNNACTNNDVCGGGSCAGTAVNGCKTCTPATQAADCNDNNSCTDEVCVSGKCTNPSKMNGVSCSDGDNACTLNDTCQAGVCTGTPVSCANRCEDNPGSASKYLSYSPQTCTPGVGCPMPTSQNCLKNLICTPDKVLCETTCVANTTDKCSLANHYCKSSDDGCVPKLAGGEMCSDNVQCLSGNCASGTCTAN